MKPIPDCVPDALAMIIATAKAVSEDAFIHSKVLLKVMGELADDGELGSHPSDVYLQCWEIACRALGVKDPYENDKARGGKTALGLLRSLDGRISDGGKERLLGALKASYAGAMLDYNSLGRVDMEGKLGEYFESTPAIDHSEDFTAAVSRAESVMLVADRAGEIALDKPLCDALTDMGKKVYVAVTSKPVFLMATERDAENVSLPSTVEIVTPGTAMFGLMPERASSEFRTLLSEVGLVVVKGGTHFSTMTRFRDLFFIVRAEEAEVADKLGIPMSEGAIVKVAAT